MAGVKIQKFLGIAPKISPELLPNTAGQVASNVKLSSGDVVPYPQPVVVANTNRTGTIKTLFALRDPTSSELKWLSWTSEVDIAKSAIDIDGEQRFHYTGDGAPKVSNYEKATSGAGPYPSGYFDLGLPVPPDSQVLTTSAASFTTKTSASFARDGGNIATVVTSTPHGLRTGTLITLSGFTYRQGTYDQTGLPLITITLAGHGLANGAVVSLDFLLGTATDGVFTVSAATTDTFQISVPVSATTSGDVRLSISTFNATNVQCTVINDTTFTYFSPGPQVTTNTYTDGKLDIGGLTQARTYVYTWYTPWEEESVAARPSETLYIKEGQVVTVTGIPTSAPAGNNFVRGVRLYRTLPTASGTEYFLLRTLWFPGTIASVQRSGNVSIVKTTDYHNLSIEDRFKISGCSDASFDITDGVVTDVIDPYTFEFSQTAGDVGLTGASGTLYHDVSERNDLAARYWGDGSYDFVDDFDSRNLLTILDSDEYDPPPEDLKGLVVLQNEIYAGFVGNQIYFSEPSKPHAWPVKYIRTVEPNIVALAVLNNYLLVMTDSYPYYVTGSDPNVLTVSRIDAQYPCVSKRSVVSMNYGVVYATHEGLAVYSPVTGPTIVTRQLQSQDSWNAILDPSTIVASFYNDDYFASHSTGAFTFERDEQVGGYFIDCDVSYTASYYDSVSNALLYVSGTNGDIYQWDKSGQPNMTHEWKSKVIVTKNFINLGAARVIADYTSLTTTWDLATQTWGAYTGLWNAADQITFRMWADKQLIYTTTLNSSSMFRLPTGYRTDTFEVGVEGNVRVRAIHLGETPIDLRTA